MASAVPKRAFLHSSDILNLSEQAHLELNLVRDHAVPPFSLEVGDGVERLGWQGRA